MIYLNRLFGSVRDRSLGKKAKAFCCRQGIRESGKRSAVCRRCRGFLRLRQVMLAADKLLLTSTIRKNATELKGKELALHKAGTICREWQVTDILLQSDCCVWMIGVLKCRHPLVLPCPGTRNQNTGWLLYNGVTNYLNTGNRYDKLSWKSLFA